MRVGFSALAVLSLAITQAASSQQVGPCKSGEYIEPSNGIISNFTFNGASAYGVRFDNACSENLTFANGIYTGQMACDNGYASPLILYPNSDCTIMTTNLSFLVWQFVPPSLTLVITQPTDGTVILYGDTYVATDPITFQADPGMSNASVDVSWTAALAYATSSGTGAYSSTQTFSTTGNGTTPITYSVTGGQVIVNATATVSGQVVNATPVTIYVTGTTIPDSTITPELLSLYSGPTSRLLVGIADKESSYQQFRTLTLYGQSGLWPNESAQDGGSHIGLMQMQTGGAARSWSWIQNATDGASWLNVTKLGIAKSLVAQIRAAHPTLPELTAKQYEQYAVELYGDHPGKYWSQQYWVPVQRDPTNPMSAWTWQLGTANPLGTAYVDDVFSRVNLH